MTADGQDTLDAFTAQWRRFRDAIDALSVGTDARSEPLKAISFETAPAERGQAPAVLLKAAGGGADTGASVRRLSSIPPQYVGAVVLAGVLGGGIYALHASGAAGTTSLPVATPAAHSPTAAQRPSTANAIEAPSPNGEASKSPKQILADAASALRVASGVELQGVVSEGGQFVRVRLVASAPRSIDMIASRGDEAYEVLSVPPATYVSGNASFWTQHFGARGAAFANHWIQTTSATLMSDIDHFAPATMARCLVEDHGTLSRGGTTSVDGQPAIVLRDAGNLPGTQPGTLAIAATGPPYPLRLTGAGLQRPGGRIDVCNDGHASSGDGTLTFSRFNQIPPLKPPTDVFRVPGAAAS